jgi:DNA topoisomerase-1
MLKELKHNGILVPPPYQPKGLVLTIRGDRLELKPLAEEMAIAWARKIGTEYVQDSGFCKNFMRDFSKELDVKPETVSTLGQGSAYNLNVPGALYPAESSLQAASPAEASTPERGNSPQRETLSKPPLSVDKVDFGPALEIVQAERLAKEQLTPEERKASAAQRKAERERLKEQYGHASVNGERVELGNYIAEPSGIFMGRGKHPLRGKWKQGAQKKDITLNLSNADHLTDKDDWAEIVWQPESLWVARWEDKLSAKLKYVWLSDTAPVKQEREAHKFDKADALRQNLQEIRAHIEQGLSDEDPKRRMVATACYLIDALCLRVGDEKDPDEADTVGATTLRPEHVTLHQDGTAEFKFLGKDSVLWHKKIQPPPVVLQNLQELVQNARPSGSGSRDKPQIFPTIDSSHVNAYLGEILLGLTAKVFRTHHATQAVRESLASSKVKARDPDYEKWGAVVQANLEAAVLCNHFKTAPANWKDRRERSDEKRTKAQETVEQYRAQARQAHEALSAIQREAREKKAQAQTGEQRERVQARYAKKIEQAKKKAETAQNKLKRAEAALGKLKIQETVASRGRTWNLGTSLKSYIDPRVYYRWGQQVDYDVLERYYPKTLQRKFAWVKEQNRSL